MLAELNSAAVAVFPELTFDPVEATFKIGNVPLSAVELDVIFNAANTPVLLFHDYD